MRQKAIPKLSELKTAQRTELLALWNATLGPPPQFRVSRELLASALAWHLQERKFGDRSIEQIIEPLPLEATQI